MPRKPNAPKKLTTQQKVFIAAFGTYRNASKAARIAKYERPGQQGWDLLNLPAFAHVAAAVRQADEDFCKVLQDQRQASLDRLVRARDFDPASLYTKAGKLKKWANIDPEDRQIIAEFTEKTFAGGSSVRVKWNNGLLAASEILKWAHLMKDQVDKPLDETEIDLELEGRFSQLADEAFPPETPPVPEPDLEPEA